MRRILEITTVCILGLFANEVSAQGPAFRPGPSGGGGYGANNGPAVSPYLNLLRRGSSPAINYYGLVRPAIDIQNSLSNLQQQVSDFAAPGTGYGGIDPQSPLVTGGNRVRFLNTGNYFLSGTQPGNLSGRSFGGGSGGSFNSQQGVGGGQGSRGASFTPQTSATPRR